MPTSSFKSRFANLRAPKRIWAVSAIHGENARLLKLHAYIFDKFKPGDRLVYLGNYLSSEQGARPIETIDELLRFRRALMARPGMLPQDIVYLRGVQEEIWQKLLQVQFAVGAPNVLEWMSENGAKPIVEAYGGSMEEGIQSARESVLAVTRWTMMLRDSLRDHPGHEKFFSVLCRAAFTEDKSGQDNNLLFVNAGLDPEIAFVSQTDSFWWANKAFESIKTPYSPFKVVIRGYDPETKGVLISKVTASLDGGCGRGGELICAQIASSGQVVDLLSA